MPDPGPDPVHVAAAALAAGENPRAALDRLAAGAAMGCVPAPLSAAHALAGQIAVACHSGDADPLALLPDLTKEALRPVSETQISRALDQLRDTLGVYYRDAENLRVGLPKPPRGRVSLKQQIKRLLGRSR